MLCPCCSGKSYAECCEPFHKGALPATPLLLMRSRYAAYALNLPDYIIETTHPSSKRKPLAQWREGIVQFSTHFQFTGLDILEVGEGSVTFTAHLTHAGSDASFSEKSGFQKVEGRWLYHSGTVFRAPKSS